ncbi:hypothetical protein A3C89_03685 [Candidatus Kaiserbacteria bacterium RIFCSPHIGHO2_02_FULL_50_50]|uniref:Anticodon-binding domain-containing protein n=1 Tax=Candidatus Kaiserbacteria bacterium RIFCSPHIGHO2_02_FULL_50_50 TaxID=1798492 RepID=A0A1F6DCA1_9BACT|nr:MAG: hypothetical protein A3C89_03685 [Candidatus Kaiserbacteria bacterium RIFCSPHIGHO2_02_FULL_50_50]OGG88046.1 MAG: hypothetical protein A3G62_01765 [Candidatus Kaiserbacteria bacterium RIFCSPLOWO2_12_FULL_50_10]
MTKAQVTNLSRHIDTVARHFDFLSLDDHCTRASEFPLQKAHPAKASAQIPEHLMHRSLVGGIHALYSHDLNARRGNHLFYTIDATGADGLRITFHAIDVAHSFADPLLIQVTRSLLSLLGYEHRIRVNMIGDKDAKRRFVKELTEFFKRSAPTIGASPAPTQEKEVLAAYRALLATDDDLAYVSPVSIDHLNEKSRRNLREILDYLDMSEAPYEIDPRLTGDYLYHSGFVFTADVTPSKEAVAPTCTVYGGAYDDYAHTHHDPRHSCASVTLHFTAHTPRDLPVKAAPDTAIALAAIGFAPKLYSYRIMDTLLQAGMSVHHNPTSLSLSEQLGLAAEKNARIILIAGTHEATRKEIIIRNVVSEKQQTIPLAKLVSTLKSLVR